MAREGLGPGAYSVAQIEVELTARSSKGEFQDRRGPAAHRKRIARDHPALLGSNA